MVYYDTLMKALNIYNNNPSSWNIIVKNCMNTGYNWDFEKLEKYKELSLKDIIETIKAAFKEAGKGMDESEVMRTFETTMQYASVNWA